MAGVLKPHDYEPAQAWVVVKDIDVELWFHHEQTTALLKAIEPVSVDEVPGDEAATLYKVDPRRTERNLRVNRRISVAVLARIEDAIINGSLIAIKGDIAE